MIKIDRPIKVLIVDDEELARQKITRYLRELDQGIQIEQATNGIEGLAKVREFGPDILFLDIQMPGLNGFEVLDHIEQRSFAIVFQTAFDEFAIKAFEANACDYLLKPFTKERFEKAFERARRDGVQRQSELGLLKSMTESKRFLEKLCVDDHGVRILLDVETICALVSRDHYTCILIGTKEYLTDLSLQKIEERLDPGKFIRIHRASIARIDAIASMSKGETPEVVLHSGLSIPVSMRCRGPLIEKLKSM